MAADDAPARPREALGEIEDIARAKVNLFLHVTGRRADGLHALESFAVFPDCGDRLFAMPNPILTLGFEGRFGAEMEQQEGNLVIDAAASFARAVGERRGAALTLEKRLPIASGLGGGSADAAATLRLLARLWGRTLDAPKLAAMAMRLGADVPVCLASAPSLMGGAGEKLAEPPGFPGFWLALVNPGVSVSTRAVFAALERRDNPPAEGLPARFEAPEALAFWLARQRNDLEAPARRLAPMIGEALALLDAAPGCLLARMSGSGATCFGLFARARDARAAVESARAARPGWWAQSAAVKPWAPAREACD